MAVTLRHNDSRYDTRWRLKLVVFVSPLFSSICLTGCAQCDVQSSDAGIDTDVSTASDSDLSDEPGRDISGADDADRSLPDSDSLNQDSDVTPTPTGCDLDGDGRENDNPGCGGDDCDDGHPNCWDQEHHGCCVGEGLIFHSEFEGAVAIEHTPPTPTSQWRLPIVGEDTMTGYDWTTGFPESVDRLHVNVQTLVGGGSELVGSDPALIDDPWGELFGTTGFVDAQVIEHPAIDGRADNRVLLFHAWRDDAMTANSRLQTSWFPPPSLTEQDSETYVAYWLKLQPDLFRVHTEFALDGDWHSRWRNLGEWWNGQSACGGSDMRIGLYVQTYNSDFVYWSVASGDLWDEDTSSRPDLAPPEDRWFFIEIYVLRHPSNGRVWVGVDGMTLFDLEDTQTMPDSSCWDGVLCYHFLKMYGDLYNYEDRLEGERPPYQFWQYYDGLRIYNRLPSGHCAIDRSCPEAVDLTS